MVTIKSLCLLFIAFPSALFSTQNHVTNSVANGIREKNSSQKIILL